MILAILMISLSLSHRTYTWSDNTGFWSVVAVWSSETDTASLFGDSSGFELYFKESLELGIVRDLTGTKALVEDDPNCRLLIVLGLSITPVLV